MIRHSGPSPLYEIFMLALSVYVLFALAIDALAPISAETSSILQYLDTGICVLFFADFLKHMITEKNRTRYFFTWGWLDLLSSIPFVGPARIGRAARIVRVIRVLRGFKSVRHLSSYILRHRAEAAFASTAMISVLLVGFSSVSILQFEPMATGGNIKTAEDALWWAYTTITTVGYGDRFPVTTEGRMIGAVLMTAGVGLFGTFTGFVAAWFMAAPEFEHTEREAVVEAAPGTEL